MTPDEIEAPLFTDAERAIIRTIERSKIWRLMRDSLCLERERLHRSMPDPDSVGADRRLWLRQGALDQLNRLLHQGPYLAVYYDRFMREQAEKGQQNPPAMVDASHVGEAPNLGDA